MNYIKLDDPQKNASLASKGEMMSYIQLTTNADEGDWRDFVSAVENVFPAGVLTVAHDEYVEDLPVEVHLATRAVDGIGGAVSIHLHADVVGDIRGDRFAANDAYRLAEGWWRQ